PRSLPLWRPWLPGAEEGTGRQRELTSTVSFTLPAASPPLGRRGLSPPLSPCRLLWPKSKAFDYLYGVGEKLLENFPVQATLCLYEDSGSEEEEEEEEEEAEEGEEARDTAAGAPPQAGSPGRPV
ncbi:RIPP1 protein, partial [Ardeotis kori]|nr:RIPP1 protein [Ardeotis kori]